MEFIETITDKLNNIVSVYFVKSSDMPSELTIFLLHGWAELIKNGHCSPNYIPRLDDNRVIYCTINGVIVSLLMWEWLNKSTFINFSFVDPEHRNNGLYEIMCKIYDSRVKAGGAISSRSIVHASNTAIINAKTKQGYVIEYFKMLKEY